MRQCQSAVHFVEIAGNGKRKTSVQDAGLRYQIQLNFALIVDKKEVQPRDWMT